LLNFNWFKDKPVVDTKTIGPRALQSVKGTFECLIDEEAEMRLSGDKYITVFKSMASNDAICGAVLLALTEIFQSITWKFEDDDDKILERSFKNVGWTKVLVDILTYFTYGHSLMEVVYKEDTDGKYVWDRLRYRPQSTIQQWNFDNRGDVASFDQMVSSGEIAEIPAYKCLLFTIMSTQANPKGKSLFRNAYRDWYYKTNIERIEAIGVERDLTGLPVLKAPEGEEITDVDGSLNKRGVWAWKVVRNIKNNSQEGLVLPPGWEVELLGSPGQRQFDLNKVIDRYSANMALSMLSQFLILGVINSSGSFALGKEQSNLFYKAFAGFALMTADVVNTQFAGAPAMQQLNGLKKQPRVVPVGIDKPDLDSLASFLGRLLKFNIIQPDDNLESYLRDRASLPQKDLATTRLAAVETPKAEPTEDEMKKKPMKEDTGGKADD